MAVFSSCEDVAKDRNSRNHLAWTAENGGSHARGVSHTGYLVYGNSKGEERGRSRYKNKIKRVVSNIEGRILDTIWGKSPKQSLTSTKDLSTID